MYTERQTIAWDHTAAVQAAILNSAPFRKNRKNITPWELNPMRNTADDDDFSVADYKAKVIA